MERWFVYILLCQDGSYYTGATNNVIKRIEDHVNGRGARYTKSHKPKKLVYQEDFATKKEAIKRERQIKKWPKTKKEALIHSLDFQSC